MATSHSHSDGIARTAVVLAPLAFAALLMLHPTAGTSFYEMITTDSATWMVVHLGSAALFPVMAWVVWHLLRDVPGRAATGARVALPVFAVAYGVFEAMVGIAAGIVAREGEAASGAGQEALAATVERIVTHPAVGELGAFNSVGAIAWIVAITGSIVALGANGAARGSLVLLAIGALMVQHVPPIGPAALVCISAAAWLLERAHARAARRLALQPA